MGTHEKINWIPDDAKLYSLDRCIKCLNVLNLGQKTMCTVVLRPQRKKKTEND